MVKLFFYGIFLILFISCGSTSSSTGAGDAGNGAFIIGNETFIENGSHSRTGFYRSKGHTWGFEENPPREGLLAG